MLPHLRTLVCIAAATIAVAGLATDAFAASTRAELQSLHERLDERLASFPPIKRLQVLYLLSEPMREKEERRERARELRKLARELRRRGQPALVRRGSRVRHPEVVDEGPRLGRELGPGPARPSPRSTRAGAPSTPNVRVNDPTSDFPTDAQSETSIASWGQYMVAAWNDGTGFSDGSNQTQGWATSTDGGQVWIDQGKLPVPSSPMGWRWASDPVVTVNPNTGAFYYAGLADASGGVSAIGVLKGRFTGETFTWTDRVSARNADASQYALDKEWIAVDPSSGRIYLTYTNFTNGLDRIEFQTADSSIASWSTPLKISADGEEGYVQGSRPVVGPDGTVYVAYYAIGLVAPYADYVRICRSSNGGSSFSTPTNAVSFFTNFSTGAPGFNRQFNVIPQFPSIAVDRSSGPYAGRLYLAWHESLNWIDDMAGAGVSGAVTETEPNGDATSADTVVAGNTIRGSISVPGDIDFFRVSLTAGQTLLVEADSVSSGLTAYVRTIATDGSTRLTLTEVSYLYVFGQDGPTYVWTAPANGTYYIRVSSKSGTGGYRIRTGIAQKGSERGSDQRDVFVASSDNGGVSWSTPMRVDDAPAGYDSWLPEVAVGANGHVYCAWYDWRDAPAAASGGESHVYLARSSNGGANWTQLGPASDTLSNWTACRTNLEPNQGDYISLYASATTLAVCWSDARGGTPDVYASLWSIGASTATVALVSATAVPGRVNLDWSVSPPDGFRAALHRTVAGANAWTLLDSLDANQEGHVVYADTAVALGTTYTYRLGVLENGTEYFRGQVSVLVPSGLGLALQGVRPNPTDGTNAFLSFTLPYAEPATVEVFDLSGRLVHTQRLTGLAAASHVVPFALWPAARSGVYLVRFTQRGQTLTSRVSIVR